MTSPAAAELFVPGLRASDEGAQYKFEIPERDIGSHYHLHRIFVPTPNEVISVRAFGHYNVLVPFALPARTLWSLNFHCPVFAGGRVDITLRSNEDLTEHSFIWLRHNDFLPPPRRK